MDSQQIPQRYLDVIEEQLRVYRQSRSVTRRTTIPETTDIPLDDQRHWLKIEDVICVYVDMKNSTQLSASTQDHATAGAYQLFTGTAVRLLHEFEAPYIDVRGDGAFALFNNDQPYRAVSAAVTIKTFAREEFEPAMRDIDQPEVGVHIGIDMRTVLVRRIGLRSYHGRTDRQNEVWAGKPVNMAAKLASLADKDELFVSDRFFRKIPSELVRKSCGCPDGEKEDLWDEVDVSADDRFDFAVAYRLRSCWCQQHGAEYCRRILALDTE